MSRPQMSFLLYEVCGIWRAEIKIKLNCHFPVSQRSEEGNGYEKLGHLASVTDPRRPLLFVSLFLLGNEKRSFYCRCVALWASSCVFMQLGVFPQNSRQPQRKSPKSDCSLDTWPGWSKPTWSLWYSWVLAVRRGRHCTGVIGHQEAETQQREGDTVHL